ncbi:hypothetical protein [Sphaerisporangium aureirubrum]|uniref:HTH domain-containing protein n=1 Tax=Sphaerisporangium aureirubrum TaxID=1544736 RepID=A0ABW1NCT8_9ACTN
MPDLTAAELARRYGVARSTVTRALAVAAAAHTEDPLVPAPPQPVNPGEPQPRYPSQEMDDWWVRRPRVGRPRRGGDQEPQPN